MEDELVIGASLVVTLEAEGACDGAEVGAGVGDPEDGGATET